MVEGKLSGFGYSLFMGDLLYPMYQDSGFEDQCAKLNGHPGRLFSRSHRMLSFIENCRKALNASGSVASVANMKINLSESVTSSSRGVLGCCLFKGTRLS